MQPSDVCSENWEECAVLPGPAQKRIHRPALVEGVDVVREVLRLTLDIVLQVTMWARDEKPEERQLLVLHG